ncbi:MAG: hypothetical protein ACRDTH_12760 [Pseudonocardiaceae bacterium]
MLARLAAIDHRLHQISTHLAPVNQLLSQLAEIHTNLETLIGSLGSAGPIVACAACELPDLELPPSPTAARGRLVAPSRLAGEAQALSALLAQVVELAADRAIFPGRWAQIAEQAMEHGCVRRAVCALDGPLR